MRSLIALVGRPNVGKSSLFNRLAKRSAALVDDMPGVTRDRHYADLKITTRNGVKDAILVDTGGFDFSKESLPASVTKQILNALEESDIVLFVTDGKDGLCPEDGEIAKILRRSGKNTILVVNKIDSPEKEPLASEFFSLGFSKLVMVSAAHGFGVERLKDAIAEYLSPEETDQGETGSGENDSSSSSSSSEPGEPSSEPGLPGSEEGFEPYSGIPKIAVIGRPNAGKSSLINKLLGSDRLVTDATPGTTRDSLDVPLERNGKKYLLIDTAGVRRKGKVSDKIEKISVIRALKSIDRADVALLMVDALEGLSDQDAHIGGYAFEKGKPIVFLLNKWDLIKDKTEAREAFAKDLYLKMSFLEKSPWFAVSALKGKGLERIFPMVDGIMEQFNFRASTSEVNKVLEKSVERHSPPQVGRVRLKFYYGLQVTSRPPSFVLFTNKPKNVHYSYRRYLINRFKEAFGLDLVPVRLFFRSRHEDADGGKK